MTQSRYSEHHVLQLTHWFNRIIQTEVETSAKQKHQKYFAKTLSPVPVDKYTGTGDPETSVKSQQSVRLHSLDVAVYDPTELSLARGVPGVHTQPGAGVVNALDEQQGEGAGATS